MMGEVFVDRESTSDLLAGTVEAGDTSARLGLKDELLQLQDELGHGHPDVLDLEEELARQYVASGDLARARASLEEVLIYRAVLSGDHGVRTAEVARDLFRLLCDQGDRPAMAEVYYRFLSWISMREPGSLVPELKAVLSDVEAILAENC